MLAQLQLLAAGLLVGAGLLHPDDADVLLCMTWCAKPTCPQHMDARASMLTAGTKLAQLLLKVCSGVMEPLQAAKPFSDSLRHVLNGVSMCCSAPQSILNAQANKP